MCIFREPRLFIEATQCQNSANDGAEREFFVINLTVTRSAKVQSTLPFVSILSRFSRLPTLRLPLRQLERCIFDINSDLNLPSMPDDTSWQFHLPMRSRCS